MPARERGSLAYCPYCAQMQLRGRKAWAIKNDCNGIFEETSRHRRADVERLLAGEWSHATDGLYLLPVRIYEDEEPDFREWEESRYSAQDGDA